MDKQIGWAFPVEGSDQWEGFNDSGIETFRGDPIVHLAREINQNSLDAAEGAVVVSFKLKELPTSSIPNFSEFKEVVNACSKSAHLDGKKAEEFFEIAQNIISRNKISVLEISDSNTVGLKGPVTNGTPYFAFMKATGQSQKASESASGSYGIGKFAPYAVSQLRTIFVSTIYEENGKWHQLTQGKSILMSHEVGDQRKRKTGFWGIVEKCQPVEGVFEKFDGFIQRSSSEVDFKHFKGTTLTIFGFEDQNGWREKLAASVAENFFGALNDGKLIVDIDGKIQLSKDTISSFFNDHTIIEMISDQHDEPEHFNTCKNYLEAVKDDSLVKIETKQDQLLGHCELRILVADNMQKRVCFLRNGMFICDELNGLKKFSDFKEFVAVFQCLSSQGSSYLRSLEPPAHDNFEPDRLLTEKERKRAKKVLTDIAKWIREKIKLHAQNPVSEVTKLDELKEYFPDEGQSRDSGKGTDINPAGKIIIQAKPIKFNIKTHGNTPEEALASEGGNDSEQGPDHGSGTGGGGTGRNEGSGGTGNGGSGGDEEKMSTIPSLKKLIGIRNARCSLIDSTTRQVSFTPAFNGEIVIRLQEAGADTDYDCDISSADSGELVQGGIKMKVTPNNRYTVKVSLKDQFTGAMKVVGYEI